MVSYSSPSLRARAFCGFSVWLLVILPFSAVLLTAQPAADSTAAVSAKQGDAIYHKRCTGCHNKQRDDDSPFGPPNLYMALHGQKALSARAAEEIVIKGKGPMPAFGAVLSKSEIRSVIAYLRTPARR
jgi:mono/diheme cytochrome c family protein